MPIFRSNQPAKPTELEARAAEVDLERIRQGGIPLGAEERLKRVAAASTPFFTSDLSSKEYLLAEASGLQPVAQVMGSSVVKHGWVTGGSYYYNVGEVQGLSQPWNISRDRAFDRLRQEAQYAAADAVIGVKLSHTAMGDPNNVELVVFGTAVRDHAFPGRRNQGVGMCTLSGQDVDKLRRIGAEVVGVVGHTTVLCIQLSYTSNWIMSSSSMFSAAGRMNVEIPEVTQGVYDARARAMHEVERQGRRLSANNIVISMLRHTIEHREYEQNGYKSHYFYVTMNVLGTAIALGAHPPHPAPLHSPLMTINLSK